GTGHLSHFRLHAGARHPKGAHRLVESGVVLLEKNVLVPCRIVLHRLARHPELERFTHFPPLVRMIEDPRVAAHARRVRTSAKYDNLLPSRIETAGRVAARTNSR